MKLDMNRICQLAGIGGKTSKRSNMLYEGADHEEGVQKEDSHYEGLEEEMDALEEEMADLDEEDEEDDQSEGMIEIDEVMLVQELRRAKRLMNESKRQRLAQKEKLQEMQLKAVIDQEVRNVINDMQLNSGWIYGKNKPKRSRKGYTHQGSFLKGIGFK